MAVHRLHRPILSLKSWLFTLENGVANLKGLSSTERAQALIALAHPAFQDGLTAAAKEMHLL
jgi:acyl-CoA hydrolase